MSVTEQDLEWNQPEDLRKWKDAVLYALPYWMGFLEQKDFLPALVAWINAHRFHGPDGLEHSWRLQAERAEQLEDQLKEAKTALENEREACAQIADAFSDKADNAIEYDAAYLGIEIAKEIRARSAAQANSTNSLQELISGAKEYF